MTSRKDNASASEPSSPACSMHEADDVYMGYAGKDELTAILTELQRSVPECGSPMRAP